MNKISIIVPCLNEENTIGLLLEAILAQSYPNTHLKVWIADGMSTDNTRLEIEKFQQNHIKNYYHVSFYNLNEIQLIGFVETLF